MSTPNETVDAAATARQLAQRLEARQQEYALGGAIALGFWGAPRGTMDVDLTLFVPLEKPSDCVWLLQEIGCDVAATEALQSLREHGFCRATLAGVRVDVFLPMVPFYESARTRRRRVEFDGQPMMIWDAETLAVFKMMFFRRKDVADLEQILRTQGPRLDRGWVRQQLIAMYGERDPRVTQWDELTAEIKTP